MSEPALVIHGVGNRDPAKFNQTISELGTALDGKYELIPVYWGDLGADDQGIADTIPAFDDVRDEAIEADITTGFTSLLSTTGPPLVATTEASPLRESEERAPSASITVDASSVVARSLVSAADFGDEAVATEIAAEVSTTFRRLQWLPFMGGARVLNEVGNVIGAELAESRVSEVEEADDEGIRGERIEAAKRFVRRRAEDLDKVAGALISEVGGRVNEYVRLIRGPGLARFLGDVLIYQRHRGEIQDRVRASLSCIGPDAGTQRHPVRVIGHSLGGVIAFDLAVAATPPMWTEVLVTFGSQSPLFHVIDPRGPSVADYRPGIPVALPDSLARWTNLWEPMDPLAFVASNVFKLAHGGRPDDVAVAHRASSGLWTHSVYWRLRELRNAIVDAFEE